MPFEGVRAIRTTEFGGLDIEVPLRGTYHCETSEQWAALDNLRETEDVKACRSLPRFYADHLAQS